MQKVLSIVFCVLLLTSSILANVSCSCDKSAPEFEGAPVSITGSFRWEDGWVYLDVIVTNNTNKGIMNIRLNGEVFRQADYSEEWQKASSFSNQIFGRSSNWLDSLNLKKAPIEANSSQTFSDKIGPSADYSGTYIAYFTAYKSESYITQVEFKGYGIMSFDSGQMEFNFEGYMN